MRHRLEVFYYLFGLEQVSELTLKQAFLVFDKLTFDDNYWHTGKKLLEEKYWPLAECDFLSTANPSKLTLPTKRSVLASTYSDIQDKKLVEIAKSVNDFEQSLAILTANTAGDIRRAAEDLDFYIRDNEYEKALLLLLNRSLAHSQTLGLSPLTDHIISHNLLLEKFRNSVYTHRSYCKSSNQCETIGRSKADRTRGFKGTQGR